MIRCGWRQECWHPLHFIAHVMATPCPKCANEEISKAQGLAGLSSSGHSSYQLHVAHVLPLLAEGG